MKLHWYINDYLQICPASPEDFEIIKKLPKNEVNESQVKKSRNYKFLQKFMVMINKGFENTKSNINNIDFYRYVMTLKAGFVDYIDYNGETIPKAKSVKFDKMDELEFEKLYNAVFSQIIIDTEADETLFRNELESFL